MPETSELIFNAIKEISKLFPFPGYMAEDNGTQGPYSSIAKTLMQYLPAGRKILDFGSGACDKTAVLQRIGYDCAACDDLQDDWHKLPGNQNKIKEFAQSQGIDFKLMTEPVIPFTDNCFDMIMLHDVLEHLHDSPRELLNSLLEISKSESFLFITVPNAVNIRKRLDVLRGKTNLPGFAGYYWYPGHWRGHIREYVREDLISLTNFLGLELLEIMGCDHMLNKVPQPLRPLYLQITRFFPDWKDTWKLVARKPSGWSPRKQLPEYELTKIIGQNSYCPG